MKRIQIITGHYGSGKTEFAVNLALHLAETDPNVALADLDIVNPYFRSYEQAKRMEDAGIRVIVTSCGGVADIPAINPEVMSIFQQDKWTGVLDIGGDPIGARVLARFAHQIREGEYDLLFVLNANRPETRTVDLALEYMRNIEAECHLKATGIVNNTHLCQETVLEEIFKGAELARALSEKTGLPIVHHAVQRKFAEQAAAKLSEPVLPMKIYMKKPWEIIFCEEE
jgi:septum formation inhibitor-activating ATPase MinD